MSGDMVILQGTLKVDGSLELPLPVQLPPGPVEVTVRAVTTDSGQDVFTVLARIRAEQQASGHRPRSKEEIDAELRGLRDEWEEREHLIERLQADCERHRQGQSATEPPT